jgi:hypothetical protein
MALISNGVRLSCNPMVLSGGAGALNINRANKVQPGALYGFYDGNGTRKTGDPSLAGADTAAIPNGYLPPHCLLLPPKAGGMSAYLRGSLALAGGSLALDAGQNITGDGTITLTGTADGILAAFVSGDGTLTLVGAADIVGALAGTGTATIELAGNLSDIIGLLPGTGDATITLTLNAAEGELTLQGTGTATLELAGGTASFELLAQMTGDGTLTLNGLPSEIIGALLATGAGTLSINGGVSVPGGLGFMTASGAITLVGAADSSGIGHMTGSTEGDTLTANSIAAAVWAALAAANNDAGSMGELLNSAGAAADPLLGVVEGALTLRDVQRLTLAVLTGDATAMNGIAQFLSLDGSKTRVGVSTTVSGGARTVTTKDPT